jgi:hypothetical protein
LRVGRLGNLDVFDVPTAAAQDLVHGGARVGAQVEAIGDLDGVRCASRVKTNADFGVSRTGISADVEHPFRTKSNAHFG